MSQVLRFLRILALGMWIGAIVYFAAVVTLGAFSVLPNRDEAGLLVGYTLGGLHLMGLIAAAVFVAASVAMTKSLKAFVEPAVIGVILMAVLTIASQGYVMPKMAVLRTQMVSVEATPGNDPRRVAFDKLHSASVDLEGGVLLLGLAALFLATREKKAVGGERQTPLP
jgi:ABC-type transport system involved in multi-copper enzyme maturation permease subunit